MIARKIFQNVTKDEASANGFQRSIGHYYKCSDEAFGQGYHYASNLDWLERFTNDDVNNP